AELAWIWLVPAVIVALAPKLRAASPLAIIAAALPVLLVLDPRQVREAAWNGFWPAALPLAPWLVFLAVPTVPTLAWWTHRHRRHGPLGTLVLGLGCGVAVILGLVLAFTQPIPCSASKFEAFHLACERV